MMNSTAFEHQEYDIIYEFLHILQRRILLFTEHIIKNPIYLILNLDKTLQHLY